MNPATMTTLRDFHNRLRILMSIDKDELNAAGILTDDDGRYGGRRGGGWESFRDDPFRWLIRADDASAEKLWSIIERRAGGHNAG